MAKIIIGYASSDRANFMVSKAQYDNMLPKNRVKYDIPLVAADDCAEMRYLCRNCGGTGDVTRADGEYLGKCDCAARRQPDAGVVGIGAVIAMRPDGVSENLEVVSAGLALGKGLQIYVKLPTPPASPVPASVERMTLALEAVEDGDLPAAISLIRNYIRDLASQPVEVVSDQRGDSTEVKGRADAVDGERLSCLAHALEFSQYVAAIASTSPYERDIINAVRKIQKKLRAAK